jgi:hypothetical protein
MTPITKIKEVAVKRIIIGMIAVAMAMSMTSISYGHASYTGYSGAPGSRGRCASSCHGTSGGAIQISGFPDQYVPGQAYTIAISHSGGNTIRQFNGSCRIGSGSQNAGVITAGTLTAVYTATGETNGVHLSATNQNAGDFIWTAPPSGTGNVTLYIAGLQGGLSGQNTEIMLTASEVVTGVDESGPLPETPLLLANYPNPFNASTRIRFTTPVTGTVSLNIYDLLGHRIVTLSEQNIGPGEHSVTWEASQYPSGIYICELSLNGAVTRRGITLLK